MRQPPATLLLLVLALHFSGGRNGVAAFAVPPLSPSRTTTRTPPPLRDPRATQHAGPRDARGTTTTTTTTPTELSVVATSAATSGFAMAAGAISGGLFAGSLHAIAGPDHLAALLPRCCGQRWYRAGHVGALWGLGHGVSATILGVIAFAVKKTFRHSMSPQLKTFLSGASYATDIAVGLSLIVIGAMGIREARGWKGSAIGGGPPPQSLSAAAVADTAGGGGIQTAQKRAVMFNGLLHGFSWDGAPSLAPALALATWGGNLAFLSAYALGTMSAMAIVTTLVGEGTLRAGQFFQRPDIPQKLSFASSILAIVIGVVWCVLGFR